ncbi:MAG: CYTH domain-containing protein [Spirochaetaceae bacterium]|jgi:adenylate cyclase class 2|nr:CYTH domain-containing protein [Spirochaetaceae bacterium]
MAIEMEIKARAEKDDCKKRMETIAGEGTAFVKDDAYWFPGGETRSGLRVRREKKSGKETILVTWKKKEQRDGMEINDEKEFAVSDGTLFEELLYSLGLRKKTLKHKEGFVWKIGGITAELTEVSGIYGERADSASGPKNLGWFLELEITSGGAIEETETEAKTRLLALLEKAGIDRSMIEDRYYTELLAE